MEYLQYIFYKDINPSRTVNIKNVSVFDFRIS